MRNEYHTSLKSLKHSVSEHLEKVNARVMSAYGQSRNERFFQEEKPLLLPLPETAFVYKHETMAKVKKNYHVILGEDWHQYSVPHEHVGKEVKLIYDDDAVEIFLNYRRIALHRRNTVRNGYSTVKEHMPESHCHYLLQRGWTPEDFTEHARKIGPNTNEAILELLYAKAFPEQAYDGCIGLLRLKNGYGSKRLEAACSMALRGPKVSYRIIKNILENNRDKIQPLQQEHAPMLPLHENIRGRQAYN